MLMSVRERNDPPQGRLVPILRGHSDILGSYIIKRVRICENEMTVGVAASKISRWESWQDSIHLGPSVICRSIRREKSQVARPPTN